MTGRRAVGTAMVAAAGLLATSGQAARFVRAPPTAEPVTIEHAFGDEAPGFTLELRSVPGEVHAVGGARPRRVDFADYSRAGRLVAHRTLAIGPLPGGPAMVPPGAYEVSLAVGGPEGLPVLGLASADGLRLRIPLVAAPRPEAPPRALTAEALGGGPGAVSVPVAIHLPTVSGLVLLGPAERLDESPLQRRRSRARVIQEELERRALESGHVRPQRRRGGRGGPP